MHSDQGIGAESKLRRKPRVTYRDLDEGGVLLDLESGAYHGLNSTGAAIWKLLEDEPTLRELLERFASRLDGPPPDLQDRVTRFLEEVRQLGLVIISGG
jgi:PqqD family protein of HPr-rel-A system